VFGCAYCRIADGLCSANTLRRRRDEWIEAGTMYVLERLAREARDQTIGLQLGEVAVDRCITKVPCGGEKAGKRPMDRGKGGSQAIRWRRRQRDPARNRERSGQPTRLAAFGGHPGRFEGGR